MRIELSEKDDGFQKLYGVMLAIYYAVLVGLAIYWFSLSDYYQLFQTFANMALPVVYLLVYRILGLKRTFKLEAVILAFTFMAYSLGVAGRWYHIVPYYDKIMHALSGAFTMFLALPAFYWLKSEKKIKSEDCALAVAFCLCATLAVAGIWEIVEYIINLVTGIDLQNVAASGVGDTMQDMIVCLAGALFMLIPMLGYYRRGKAGFLMDAVFAFCRNNPGLYAKQAD
ncbi:MAG: DUF2238 domain-containing protein [Clostridia bacterium]|nr:DUF2238 domain-containing protein [Clostridia bacterium]